MLELKTDAAERRAESAEDIMAVTTQTVPMVVTAVGRQMQQRDGQDQSSLTQLVGMRTCRRSGYSLDGHGGGADLGHMTSLRFRYSIVASTGQKNRLDQRFDTQQYNMLPVDFQLWRELGQEQKIPPAYTIKIFNEDNVPGGYVHMTQHAVYSLLLYYLDPDLSLLFELIWWYPNVFQKPAERQSS